MPRCSTSTSPLTGTPLFFVVELVRRQQAVVKAGLLALPPW
ncbi:MAG TPA: hypothetical protein VF550_22650 [Polyangia bacterium]